MVNACRHRGTLLCPQNQVGSAKELRCPYHGWNFDIDGKLIGVPWPKANCSWFRKEDWGLIHLPKVASYRGFVFASLSKDVPALEEHLGPGMGYIDAFVDLSPEGEIEVRSGIHRTGINGNWKQACENSMDGYHPAVVHASYLKDVIKHRVGKDAAGMSTGNSIAEVAILPNGHGVIDYTKVDRSGAMGPRVDPKVMAEHRVKLTRRLGEQRANHLMATGGGDSFNLLLFPNLVFINVQLRVFQPIRFDRTDIHVYPTTLKGAAPEINTARLRAHEDFYGSAGFGMPDDFELLERQWAGIQGGQLNTLLIERGMERERVEGSTRIGQLMDETNLRGIWRHWKNMMLAAT
jgi:phenylpropionate dioxygenase-like ring-hydroxylating dioxygenase large terminal subunit